jgi:hypothetical protein
MSKLQVVPRVPGERAEEIPSEADPDAPMVGKWYWVKDEEPMKDAHPYLACVVHIGSNYAEVHGAGDHGYQERIHVDHFWARCTPERSPDRVIAGEVQSRQQLVVGLMKQVHEITARLAITPGLALSSGSETQALALRKDDRPVGEYKAALVKAKDVELPELFKEIESTNRSLSNWMKASLIPLKAQVEAMKPSIDRIKERIFSVELYAGLVEEVEQVREGKPAELQEKVRLLQRRCYMDEECLADYQTGGMEIKGLRGFDRWLAKKANLERVMPFQRCMVAFQVRRFTKEREWHNMREFFKIVDEEKFDKLTFLYIRNGDQLFRLSTAIDFGSQLFPDMTGDQLGGKIYARCSSSGSVEKIITEGRWQEMVAEERKEDRENAEKRKKAKKEDRWQFQRHSFHDSTSYHEFSPKNVYHDDILKHVQDEMNRHNRLVLVLQGLLDRSPVLHPHPPWSLWNPDSFRSALDLVYDDSRALTTGDVPDFEAYRAKCNASLKVGSVTVGQEVAWERAEARKENDRLDNDHRTRRSDYRHTRYRPHGNPGPGILARVHWVQPKIDKLTYAWNRERQAARNFDDDGPKEVRCTFSCKSSRVLNVDAYKPGDFKIFFSDPRTRADYLKWAPLLLEAEEYHAGNRRVKPVPPAPPPKEPSWEGQRRYAQRKQRKALMGKAVRLVRDVTMKSKKVYVKGTLWRVTDGKGSTVCVSGINEDGTWEKHVDGDRRGINNLDFDDVSVDPAIPDLPKKEKKPDPETEDDEDDEDDDE